MMKLLIVALFLLIASTNAIRSARGDFSQEWDEWKIKHGKQYAEREEEKRQMIWEENRRFVAKHNYEYDLGIHTFTVGMNKFADMRNDEFKAMYLAHVTSSASDGAFCAAGPKLGARYASNPTKVDWRTQGYVTPVKDQAQCGSCWAFSATGSLEGAHFKANKKLVSLSEQNLVDCSAKYGNEGCGGGFMESAFEYIFENGGIDTELSYPYTAMDGKCRFNKTTIGATLSSCVDVDSENEKALENAVADIGPVSVAIDAGHLSFQMYKDGIYYEEKCSTTILDHGVLVVGYGDESGQAYWMVKNSWGASWGGLEGYIKMSKNKGNNCGIATKATYPIV